MKYSNFVKLLCRRRAEGGFLKFGRRIHELELESKLNPLMIEMFTWSIRDMHSGMKWPSKILEWKSKWPIHLITEEIFSKWVDGGSVHLSYPIMLKYDLTPNVLPVSQLPLRWQIINLLWFDIFSSIFLVHIQSIFFVSFF